MGSNWRGAAVALSVAGMAGLAHAAPAPNRPAAPAPRPAAPSDAGLPSAPALLATGAAVVAIGAGGGAFADSIVSYNLPAMTVKAAFTRPGANFVGAPVVFSSGPPPAAPAGLAGRGGGGGANAITPQLVAAQGRDGRIIVLNSDLSVVLTQFVPAALSGRPLGLVAWEESPTLHWLLAATTTGMTAYKVTVANNDVALTKAWSQSGLNASALPVVTGGAVLVSSSAAPGGAAKAGTPRGLYAFDAKTGSRM